LSGVSALKLLACLKVMLLDSCLLGKRRKDAEYIKVVEKKLEGVLTSLFGLVAAPFQHLSNSFKNAHQMSLIT